MNAPAQNHDDTLSNPAPFPLPAPGSASAGSPPGPAPAQTAASIPPTHPQPEPADDNGPPRGNGKIPHLAKEHIDAINQLFDAGDTYRVVRQKLAHKGVDVNLANLSGWYHGGYQDHLQARERRDQVLQTQQLLLEFANDPRAPDLTLVGLNLGVTQLANQLLEMAPGSHKEHFQTDTQQYLRMLNTLARMSKSLLALQKYHDDTAIAQSAQLEHKDVNRDLSDNEYDLLINRMDQVFRRPRRRRPTEPPANGNGVVSPADASSARSAGVLPAGSTGLRPIASSPPPAAPESAPTNQHPATSVPAAPVPVEIQNSEIKNPPVAPPPSEPNNDTSLPPADSAPTPLATEPATDNRGLAASAPAAPAPIENQKSEIKNPNPPGHCPACKILLPPLLKNGERSIPVCPKCGSGLCPPPSWNRFDYPPPKINPTACDICRQRHQLDPNGLPDPCPQCGFHHLTHPVPPATPQPDSA